MFVTFNKEEEEDWLDAVKYWGCSVTCWINAETCWGIGVDADWTETCGIDVDVDWVETCCGIDVDVGRAETCGIDVDVVRTETCCWIDVDVDWVDVGWNGDGLIDACWSDNSRIEASRV